MCVFFFIMMGCIHYGVSFVFVIGVDVYFVKKFSGCILLWVAEGYQ